jgi:flagellar biosynthesis/type III secretory pathway protein FliH
MTWSSDWTGVASTPAAPEAEDPWSLEEIEAARTTPLRSHSHAPAASALSEVQAEALRIQAELEEAYARGLEDGLAEAQRAMGAQFETALAAVTEAARALQASQSQWTHSAEQHIHALSVAVAQHVINRELRGDVHAVPDLVRRALAHYPLDEAVRIRLNPQDLSIISTAETGPGLRIAPGRNVQWLADSDVAPGGCLVEGRRRVVDGRVDHALERIYRQLADA